MGSTLTGVVLSDSVFLSGWSAAIFALGIGVGAFVARLALGAAPRAEIPSAPTAPSRPEVVPLSSRRRPEMPIRPKGGRW